MLIDSKKRNTIKALGGITALGLLPSAVSAATKSLYKKAASDDVKTIGQNISVSMVSGHGRWHSVKITNTGTSAVTVKHVHPGIVGVNQQLFDVNALFKAGPVVIEPGKSFVGAVAAVPSNAVEPAVPQGLAAQNRFQLASQYSHFGEIKPVVTMRNFYA